MLSDKRYIVLHHSLTKDSGTVSWDAIRRYHVETNKWRAIGYHYGIELVGATYEILLGRMIEEDAAAVKEANMNRLGIHICLIGNFDEAAPPVAQWNAAARLVASLATQFSVPMNRIVGHRDFASYKSCPGTLFDLGQFRLAVQRQLAA